MKKSLSVSFGVGLIVIIGFFNKKTASDLSNPGLSHITTTSKDAMKLRKTGFERSPAFVIRLGINASLGEGWGPPSVG